jgi:hypothetical protein
MVVGLAPLAMLDAVLMLASTSQLESLAPNAPGWFLELGGSLPCGNCRGGPALSARFQVRLNLGDSVPLDYREAEVVGISTRPLLPTSRLSAYSLRRTAHGRPMPWSPCGFVVRGRDFPPPPLQLALFGVTGR